MLALILITLFAAFVNGGLGYGFSSITVPVGLLFFSNRVLNPALVLVEIGANIYTVILNRKNVARIWKRIISILIGLLPAIILGSLLLRSLNASWVKLATYCFLTPLILLQGMGFRRPLRTERAIGAAFGGMIGLLYSVTTISGPPLAMMLNNEGFEKSDFRAALGVIRVVESSFTAAVYYWLGFYTPESLEIFKWIVPGVLVMMPLGSVLLGKLDPGVFRRICISVDAWLIGYGLLRALGPGGWFAFAAIVMIDGFNLTRFLRARPAAPVPLPGPLPVQRSVQKMTAFR
jgi:uncharacterized membrane protein YfcA